jgi:hypothetical protein
LDILVGGDVLTTVTADGSGAFSHAFSTAELKAIGQGQHSLVARLKDAPSGSGRSAAFTFTVDTLRATSLADELIGTSGEDQFIFAPDASVTGSSLRYDTIADYQVGDSLEWRGIKERVMGAPKSRLIRGVEGEAGTLSFKAINEVLGDGSRPGQSSGFRPFAIGAFQVSGMDGTFLAVNNGTPRFEKRDTLVFLEGFEVSSATPVLLA